MVNVNEVVDRLIAEHTKLTNDVAKWGEELINLKHALNAVPTVTNDPMLSDLLDDASPVKITRFSIGDEPAIYEVIGSSVEESSRGDKTIVLYGVNGDRECTHRTLLVGDIKHTAYGEWYLLKVHDVGWGPWGPTTSAILTIVAKNNKVNYEADSVL